MQKSTENYITVQCSTVRYSTAEPNSGGGKRHSWSSGVGELGCATLTLPRHKKLFLTDPVQCSPARHCKRRFFCAVKTLVLKFCARKRGKRSLNKEKTVKEVQMHKFIVCACKSQDFAQSKKNFARSHNRETMTFRNFEPWLS